MKTGSSSKSFENFLEFWEVRYEVRRTDGNEVIGVETDVDFD